MGSGGTTKPPQFTQGQPTGLPIRNGDALSNFLSLSSPPVHSPHSRWLTVAPYRRSSFRGHWEPQQAQRLGS